jgi:putative phosphoserine phosphatase/1-acylglycerol-3-phosphate O-acyltransferase
MHAAAIFDLDRTLLAPPSSERAFFRYLFAARELTPALPIALMEGLWRQLPRGFVAMTKGNKYIWKGWRRTDLEAAAQRCFDDVLRARIYPQAEHRIAKHRAQGHQIILLSGTLDLLLEPFAEHWGADLLICSRLETNADGCLTGRIVGPHPYGSGKRSALQEAKQRHGIDLERSWAYADDASDVGVLSLVGHPVATNPSRELARIASRLGWECVRFDLTGVPRG